MNSYGEVVTVGILMGSIARFALLKIDYRQYPSYPQGYLVHLALGFIAASLGAVAVPALIEKEYTAVTFLALAAQQFRDIRSMERESLAKLEDTELVPRGSAYIEDIAKVFESRNYMAIFTSLGSSLGVYYLNIFWGIITGMVLIILFHLVSRRQTIRSISIVREGKLHFKGPLLYVEDILIMNVGLKNSRKIIKEKGLGVIIEPKDDNARATLANMGQRQAIAHDASALLGIRKDFGEPEFTPLIRRNHATGEIGMFIIPSEPDIKYLIEAVKRVPVIESSKRTPLSSEVGKKAAD